LATASGRKLRQALEGTTIAGDGSTVAQAVSSPQAAAV
jgi:hypothetical protein